MKKIQKVVGEKNAKPVSDSRKIHVDGKVGMDVNIEFPGSAEVDGGARIHIKLPTWLTLDILKRLFKPNQHDEQ